jgi:hypothetical protein
MLGDTVKVVLARYMLWPSGGALSSASPAMTCAPWPVLYEHLLPDYFRQFCREYASYRVLPAAWWEWNEDSQWSLKVASLDIGCLRIAADARKYAPPHGHHTSISHRPFVKCARRV